MSHPLAKALVFVPLLAISLAGCGFLAPEPIPSATPSPSGSTSPTGEPEAPVVLDPDILLLVQATATTDAGEPIALTVRVHSSTAWNDIDASAATRPDFMSSACAGYLDSSVFADQAWGFALIDFSAQLSSPTGTWPADVSLAALPAADGLPIAGGGILVDDQKASAETPHCARDKFVAGAGDGTIVAGFEGDAASLFAWADHTYGIRVEGGATLTSCTIILTGAGELAGGGTGSWGESSTATECSAGS